MSRFKRGGDFGFGEKAFVGAETAGGVEFVCAKVIEGVEDGGEIVGFAGHGVGESGAAKGVDVTVGVIGHFAMVFAGCEEVNVVGVASPVTFVFPDLGEIAVFGVPGKQVGAVEVFAQGVPFCVWADSGPVSIEVFFAPSR